MCLFWTKLHRAERAIKPPLGIVTVAFVLLFMAGLYPVTVL